MSTYVLRFPSRQARLWISASILTFTSAAFADYKGIDLYSLPSPPGFTSISDAGSFHFVSATQMVGAGTVASGNANALVWSNGAPTAINLNPPGFADSYAIGTDGLHQVGYGMVDNSNHALLWSGTAASAVDLHPTNLGGFAESIAMAVNMRQQVGYGTAPVTGVAHALLWHGTASSAVDLNPSGFYESYAEGASGNQQIGYGGKLGDYYHALLWTGDASTVIDLHPSGFTNSYAFGTDGYQQVGTGLTPDAASHALMWTGTAASVVDLQPTNLSGFEDSTAYDTNGLVQVGFGRTGDDDHALLWHGSADSTVDLQNLLPQSLIESRAYFVDSSGNVFGTAVEPTTGVMHAVEWIQVPESSALAAVALAGVALIRRRGRTFA
ncbi:MAG TPA: hypothetical protein VK797_01390 [Tepidisphaeraceae bacterium]|jgi:hypothetical protein|nr:hypothetical protein [Tepidisphaeraceae bacterium]